MNALWLWDEGHTHSNPKSDSAMELQAMYNRHRDIYNEALLYRPIDKRDVLRFRSKIMRACCIRRQHLVLCEDGSLWRVMLGANGALRKHRQAWTAEIQGVFEGGA